MPSSPQRHEAVSPGLEDEFVKMQFEQTFATLRTHLTLLVQTITISVIANVTVVGFAVAERVAGVLLGAALFPLAVIVVTYIVSRLAVPLYYTAVSLESNYRDSKVDWLGSTFASFIVSDEYVADLRRISKLDAAKRTDELHALPTPWLGSGRGYSRLFLILLAVGQVTLAIVLAFLPDWRFF